MRAPLAAQLLWACSGPGEEADKAADTANTDTDDTTTTWEEPPPYNPSITTTQNADGTFSTLVQAIDGEVFTYLSFSAGGVRVGDPTTTAPPTEPWEMAFRRDEIRINGGVTGTGGVDAAILEGIALESIAWAPVAGFTTDGEDLDGDDRADGPFSGWFAYDLTTHTLSAAEQTYVLRSPQGVFRIRMDGYYSPDDNSGWPSLTWAPIEGTGPVTLVADAFGNEALEIDASAEDSFVFLSLAEQMALAPAAPEESDDWDVAFGPTDIATNGGASGIGARTVSKVTQPFDDVLEVPPAPSFVEDEPDSDSDGVPEYAIADWYDIDPITYAIVPRTDTTFVVMRPDTSASKMAIVGYYDEETGTPGFPLVRTSILQEAPETTESTP